eukprot:TRINITY_DN65284_c0_g1_i1.p1 TRINITY_DN65284_c0_g1~~TRINITY_DN65284_c0_g1_i1.p1  ORF type:complete len:285 (-),score=25.96 TRINITY_DN65284_c0_g1_i1:29-883(-)
MTMADYPGSPEGSAARSSGPSSALGDYGAAIGNNFGVGDVMLARFPGTTSHYWARVSRISSSSDLRCDVEWLRPFAGQPGTRLYACNDGRDDTQGRAGLRPRKDFRRPVQEDLALGSYPPAINSFCSLSCPVDAEWDTTVSDIPDEETIIGLSPISPHASGKARPGANLASMNRQGKKFVFAERPLFCGMEAPQPTPSVAAEHAISSLRMDDALVDTMPDSKVLSLPELPPVPKPVTGNKRVVPEESRRRSSSSFVSFLLYGLQLEMTCCAASDPNVQKPIVVL